MHNREVYLARLLCRTDVVATCLSQKKGDIRPLLQTVLLVREMAFWNAIHMVSSHQTRDLDCLVVSSNILWNPPTILCPDLTATIQQRCLPSTLRTALSAIPICFPICVALTYNESRKDLHWLCQIPWNYQRKWLLVSSSAPGTSLSSSGYPGKILFHTGMIESTMLPSLVPPRHIDDCFEIHFLHWELCHLL